MPVMKYFRRKSKKPYIKLSALKKPKVKSKYTYIGDASGYIKVVPNRKKIPINKLKIKKPKVARK